MGWREMVALCPVQEGLMETLRRWLLVVLLAWVAGWQMMDVMLQQGAQGQDVAGRSTVWVMAG